jgi:hypothetical protein
MAISYSWEVTGLKKCNYNNLSGVVYQTYWKKVGIDENGYTGEFKGATPFDPSKVDSNNYVQFEDLTEQIVLNWIKAVVVDGYETHVNLQIEKQIFDKLNAQAIIFGPDLPWNKP